MLGEGYPLLRKVLDQMPKEGEKMSLVGKIMSSSLVRRGAIRLLSSPRVHRGAMSFVKSPRVRRGGNQAR